MQKEIDEGKAVFELVMVTRDVDGNPTGTKTIKSNSGSDIEKFYMDNQPKPKKRKDKKKGKIAPKATHQRDIQLGMKLANERADAIKEKNRIRGLHADVIIVDDFAEFEDDNVERLVDRKFTTTGDEQDV